VRVVVSRGATLTSATRSDKIHPDDPVRLSEIALAFDGDPADPEQRAVKLRQAFLQHAAAVRRVYGEIVR
jgi:hypothetical protein